MEKMKMHTPNLTDENILKIRELFPSVVTEAKDENGELKLVVDLISLNKSFLTISSKGHRSAIT